MLFEEEIHEEVNIRSTKRTSFNHELRRGKYELNIHGLECGHVLGVGFDLAPARLLD